MLEKNYKSNPWVFWSKSESRKILKELCLLSMGFPNKIRNSVRKILEELFSLFRYHQTAQLLPEKILKKQKRKKLLLLSESSSEADQSSIFIYISIQFFIPGSLLIILWTSVLWPQSLNSQETASTHFLLTQQKNSETCLALSPTHAKLAGWDPILKLPFFRYLGLGLPVSRLTLNSGIRLPLYLSDKLVHSCSSLCSFRLMKPLMLLVLYPYIFYIVEELFIFELTVLEFFSTAFKGCPEGPSLYHFTETLRYTFTSQTQAVSD